MAPSGPPALLYNGIAGEAPQRSPLFDAVVHEVVVASKAADKPAPQSDPRLYRVAEDLALIVPRDSLLPYAPVAFVLNHYGIIEPTPRLLQLFADPRDPAAAAGNLSERLRAMISQGDYQRLGIGTVPRDQGQHATVVLLQKSFLETAPIPRVMQPHDAFRLEVRIADPFFAPYVVITRDDGSVIRTEVTMLGERRFRSVIGCGGRLGPQQIEIGANSERGPTVLANFPVWCGREPPVAITYEPQRTTPGGVEVDVAEQHMAELINLDRRRAGLAPLAYHPAVADVARQYSDEMAATGIVAHVSESSGSASDRLRRAGIRTTQVNENLARGSTVEEAHRSLMGSPAHRANTLSPNATHIGVGITVNPGELPDLFVTELYIRIPPDVDPDELAVEVARRVEAASNLRRHSALDDVAMQHARRVVRGVPLEVAVTEAIDALKKKGATFQRIKSLLSVVGSLDSFDPSPAGTDPRMTNFGVGIAQGSHPKLGENAIFIVVMIGTEAGGD